MAAMWVEGFKQVRDSDDSTLSWGQTLGAYGFTVERRTEELQGTHYTELSLRRVLPSGRSDEELQMSVEVTQRYKSGANSRSMYGSITLRGAALDEFCMRVLERSDSLQALLSGERKPPKRVETVAEIQRRTDLSKTAAERIRADQVAASKDNDKTARLLQEFDDAAQIWGHQSDQGVGEAVKQAEERYNKAHHALLVHMRSLERRA